MMKRFEWLGLAIAMLSPSALAQPSPTEVSKREAEQRYQEGRELVTQRKFLEARTKFAESCAANHTPKCVKNLGLAEFELGLYAEATVHLTEYLRDATVDGDPTIPRIREFSKEAYAKCGHLEIVAPVGAEVRVDDARPLGRAPITEIAHVKTGAHSLRATDTEGHTATAAVTAVDGQVTRVTLRFSDVPMPPSGLPDPSSSKDNTSGAQAPKATDTAAVTWPPPTHAVVLGGVAVVALGVGIGFSVDAGSKNDRVRAAALGTCGSGQGPQTPACASLQDTIDARDRSRTIGTTFLVVGGIAAAAMITTWVIWPRRETKERGLALRVLPDVGPRLAALHLVGSF